MNDRKLNQLFRLSREEAAPAPSEGFDARVLMVVRGDMRPAAEPVSLWDQLGLLFPRLALATGLLIGLCVLADFHNTSVFGSVSTGVNQISEQWQFAANEN